MNGIPSTQTRNSFYLADVALCHAFSARGRRRSRPAPVPLEQRGNVGEGGEDLLFVVAELLAEGGGHVVVFEAEGAERVVVGEAGAQRVRRRAVALSWRSSSRAGVRAQRLAERRRAVVADRVRVQPHDVQRAVGAEHRGDRDQASPTPAAPQSSRERGVGGERVRERGGAAVASGLRWSRRRGGAVGAEHFAERGAAAPIACPRGAACVRGVDAGRRRVAAPASPTALRSGGASSGTNCRRAPRDRRGAGVADAQFQSSSSVASDGWPRSASPSAARPPRPPARGRGRAAGALSSRAARRRPPTRRRCPCCRPSRGAAASARRPRCRSPLARERRSRPATATRARGRRPRSRAGPAGSAAPARRAGRGAPAASPRRGRTRCTAGLPPRPSARR